MDTKSLGNKPCPQPPIENEQANIDQPRIDEICVSTHGAQKFSRDDQTNARKNCASQCSVKEDAINIDFTYHERLLNEAGSKSSSFRMPVRAVIA